MNAGNKKMRNKSESSQEGRISPRTVYFSFCHPDVSPGGAQAVAKRLHDEHVRKNGAGSSLFIGAMIGGGPKRSAGTNLIQVKSDEFIYVCDRFDYLYFTNYDYEGQQALIRLVESFDPTHLHFHHFMGFGVDFMFALLSSSKAKKIFTVHEHMLVCHNDGHLVQRNNNGICDGPHPARCATCMPEYRYDYFQHRLSHLASIVEMCDVVTAVSQYTADVIQRSIKTKEPIVCIPNGPFRTAVSQESVDTNVLNIAYIGQVHQTKGVHLLLAALESLVEINPEYAKRVSITIWGSIVQPEYRKKIEAQLARLHALEVRSKLGGVYSSSNLKNILHDANVVVVPSLWPESYCITADEAVMLGKILICTEFPAATERFESTESTVFVSPGSSVAIERAFEKLLKAGSVDISSNMKFSYESFSDIYDLYEQATL